MAAIINEKERQNPSASIFKEEIDLVTDYFTNFKILPLK
jgi:hypothetical protein